MLRPSTFQSPGEMLAGTLGITLRGGPLPGFTDYVQKMSPKSQPQNPFLKMFWEHYFNCSCPEDVCKDVSSGEYELSGERLLLVHDDV